MWDKLIWQQNLNWYEALCSIGLTQMYMFCCRNISLFVNEMLCETCLGGLQNIQYLQCVTFLKSMNFNEFLNPIKLWPQNISCSNNSTKGLWTFVKHLNSQFCKVCYYTETIFHQSQLLDFSCSPHSTLLWY